MSSAGLSMKTRSPGRFILTGSATPTSKPTHSGAMRITPVRMRPLTLFERGAETPTVSLAALLSGERPGLSGDTEVTLEDYTDEILAGGFPAMRHGAGRARSAALGGYLERIVDVDLPELGLSVRHPQTLMRWLRAYAAATSTTTSFEKIRAAATSGAGVTPAKTTAIRYQQALERIWILDPVAAWAPTNNHLARLTGAPKHHLADPALAAHLVGIDQGALLSGEGPGLVQRDGSFLGALFESLTTLDVRVLAQVAEATTGHVRTRGGNHEIDLVAVRRDQKVVAIEVKLSATIHDKDVAHLRWFANELGDDLLDAIVISTGPAAYRRADGIGVVPLALLGP